MRAANVVVRELKTEVECTEAIEAIERDPANFTGGINAFYSGRETFLTAGAAAKIAAITRRLNEMVGDDEEGM